MATATATESAAACEPRPWLRSLGCLATLGPFFFLSYGFANWVSSRRAFVPSAAFAWESHIPFLPWTIIPYWSSDLLYAASLLVCATRRELDLHVKRLVAVQLIAVGCFLAFPLRCAFVRPAVDGAFGLLFGVLAEFDKPFNQAPSLHVALAVILWNRFAAHLQGLSRVAMGSWLILVSLSTLTTWQHQFIDLPTGLLAGWLAMAMAPGGMTQRMRLAAFYLTGAALLTASAFRFAGLAWILLWPAAALMVVAPAYLLNWPGIFQKREGVLHPALLLIAAPYVAAAWINSRWWTRGAAAAHEIAGGVWLGRAPAQPDRDPMHFKSIVDVSAEMPVAVRGAAYRAVPMLDLTTPSEAQLRAAVAAIREFEDRRPTLVCCALGFSRSAAAVAAWLVASGRAASAAEAAATIRARRPGVVL